MELKYPKTLETKEDIEFVVKNFPKEIWKDDLNEIYELARGYKVIGKNPKFRSTEIVHLEKVWNDERKVVEDHDADWGEATIVPNHEDQITFKYQGIAYLARYQVLPESVVAKAGIDIDWLERTLFGFNDLDKVVDEMVDIRNESDTLANNEE